MEELLLKLKAHKGSIKVVEDSLKISLPKGFSDTDLIDELKINKENLIQYIKDKNDSKRGDTNIPKATVKEAYSLTPPQLRLFLLDQLNNDSLAYNLPAAFRIEGPLDAEKLESAFNSLIKRHENLRTSFSLDDDNEPSQKIAEDIEFRIEHYEIEGSIENTIDQFVRPFDLATAPLLRVGLIKETENIHYFLFDIHHIISDGTSTEILIREVIQLYMGLELDPVKLQYKDFSEWFLSPAYQESVAGQKEFWNKQFNELPESLELPMDHARPKDRTHSGATLPFAISKEESDQLNQIGRKNSTTLFTVLLATYSIMLSKLGNAKDLVIGTPVAGRKHADLQDTIGMFVNTLALPTNLADDISFNAYLKQLHEQVLGYFDNADYPYEKLINDLQLDRDPSRNPLFDVVFALQNMQKSSMQMDDLTISEYEREVTTSKFDLMLEANEIPGGINFSFGYATELFEPSTIQKFIGFFKRVLSQVLQDQQVLIGDISLLSDEETVALIQDTNTKYPETATLISLFEDQVAKTPDNEAVIFKGKSLTYKELNNLSNALALTLREKGVGRDTIVGLLTDKNIHTVVCQLGILKAGGCYLPIDPTYPEERINYIAADSGIQVLVTNKDYESLLNGVTERILIEDVVETASEEIPNPEQINQPQDLCYIIYTSGTTGNPKGVMVEHRNAVRLFFNDEFQFDFDENDVWTMFHSHCFDFSVWEMYGALLFGGKVIIIAQSDARDPNKYLEMLQNHKVTVLNQTPTAFDSLRTACAKDNVILSDLRYVIFGGEALTPLKLKDWHAAHPNVKLVNMYGITEITVHATYKEIGTEEIENNVSNIGKAIPTNSLYILDSNKNLLPQGVIGEIYVGGHGVTRGYLNKEELTASRFMDNPFNPGERLYKSGDLGRLLDNGEVEYLGRIDNQVQLKGFRIELNEIEYHLLKNDHIAEAVVILRDADTSRPYLCAYYVSKGGEELNDLRNYLTAYLPKYMIPSYFVALEDIPFTSNNKIDVNKLPAPDSSKEKDAYVAPTNEREKILCKVWEAELGVELVGTNDNYFSLGGDSLKAIGLVSSINKALGTTFTIADLYSNQTIAELLSIENSSNDEAIQAMEEARKDLVAFQEKYKEENEFPDAYEAVYPMNGVEMGMVFYTLQTKSDNVHEILYHEQNLYDMPLKNFDFDRFKKVINLICQTHGELRKVFDLENLAHIIKKEIDPEINFIDICHLDKTQQEEFIKEKMHEEKLRGTELSFSVIWRMNVIKIREDYQYLLFDFNHSLFDGWSLSSFMTEIQRVYLCVTANENYQPQPLKSTYEDQILTELAAGKKESSINYWKKELEEYTRYELPKTGQEHEFVSTEFNLGKAYRKQLEAIAAENNTSFKHICFAAYIYMLRMFSYSNDITTGIATNIRPLVHDAEKLLGCFLNTIPFRADIPDGITWREYLSFIENKLRDLKYHEQVPFHKILEIIGEGRNEKNPIFDVFFNYIDFRILKELEPAEETIAEEETTLRKDYMNDHGLLTTHIFAHDSDFNLVLTYSTAFISAEQVNSLSYYFKGILDCIVNNPDALINKETLIEESDLSKVLLTESNGDNINYPSDATLVSLFEDQVNRTPDNEAVCFNEEVLTYAEVNSLANAVAARLKEQGVTRDTIVGLLTDKNLYTVVCQLGILKAGGCYLPIDPGYPNERIEYIVEDSGLQLLLTNEGFQEIVQKPVQKIKIEELISAAQGKNTPNPEPINSPEDLCYIIYTSGTTGNPKGVMVEHQNVVRLFFNDEFQFDFGADDVWTMFHSHCFDFSVWEMYGALLYGGKVVIVAPSDARDPFRYLEILKAHKVTVLNQTPTAFDSLRSACAQNNDTLPHLKYVVFGGEALTPVKLKEWQASHPDVKLVNMYGITEITVHATYKEIGMEEISSNISNIGKAIPTNSMYLLDSNKHLQPAGMIGEIYVGGLGVTRGYLNKEELTASRFTENRYNPGDRLYRSGDLGRLLPNGEIEYLGRIDNQVQLKGFRIELSEIEYHLLKHEQIEEAIVILRDNNTDRPYLCAYYVVRGEEEPSDLRGYLGASLPKYMIPSYFVELNEIPFTSNNKVAVSKLPAPSNDVVKDAYVAPATDREKAMCNIWETELGVEQVGLNDNYFALGGDSLKAIGLISAINKKMESSFTIADLYSYQTIGELLGAVLENNEEETQARDEASRALREFQERYKSENEFLESYEEVYPMNGVEMGMVFHSLQTQSENVHEILYHEQNLYDIPGADFDFETFRKGVQLMCEKHGELRKIFDLENLAHIITKSIEPEINFIDIRHLDKAAQEEFINEKMHEEKVRGTDLSFSVIWRMNVIKIRDDYQYLLFDFNHSLFDGWSLSSFMTELQKVCLNLYEDEHYIPEPLQSSYEDQILGELTAAKRADSVAYWQEELDNYTRFELSPTGLEHSYVRDEITFGKEYRQQLEQVAENNNTSFKHICFAAYIYMLRVMSFGGDITAGITTNIRPLVHDAEKLLGCFLNTIPFRANIPEHLTWAEYLNFIENKLRDLKYHEQMPFYKILEIVNEESTERNPIFDVSFNYVDFRIYKDLADTGEGVSEETTSVQKAYMNDYALLGIHIHAFDGDFNLELNYSTAFITQEQAKALSGYFKCILDQFINNATVQADKQTILETNKGLIDQLKAVNDTSVAFESDKHVLDLFNAQVVAKPEATALVFGDTQVSYQELNDRSHLWARNLINSGITPGAIVGMRMDRSVEMLTALLAIMKAGAAYMVIDAQLPDSRVIHMLEETGCSGIISNKNNNPIGLSAYQWINVQELDEKNEAVQRIELPQVKQTDLAYILYTSGSTGKPKGCMISHQNLYNYISWSNGHYFNEALDGNWGLITPLSFDLTVTAVFTSLTRGNQLFIYDDNTSIDQLLKDCFTHDQIDTLKLTPTHITILDDLNIKNSNIRTIICGGEQLKSTHIDIIKKINPDIRVYNEYGPTETTVGCTVAEIESGDKISIGSPIANTKIHILDRERKIVPMGVTGEIYISGEGVASGYIGNPALTDERFIDINGYRSYKTGDLGRWDASGNIEYVGRIDDQIKIRGFRIELGEIEAALEKIPGITQAFATDFGDGENKQVCAYLLGEHQYESPQLNRMLESDLPVYMIPSAYIKVDNFPLTKNGKIDKDSLPLPNYSSTENYVAPETPAEHRMVNIWAEVLELDPSTIGVNDNFFKIGGHSLNTIKLKNRISKVLSVDVELKDLFTYSTIRFLLSHISKLKETQHVSIPKAEENEYYPLSSAQNRMYFQYEFNKQGTTYNTPSFYMLDGEVDAAKLASSFKQLIERHESLRTTFAIIDDIPVQQIISADSFEMKQIKADESELNKHIESFVQPFDLSKELPVRLALVELSPTNHLLMLDLHHIVSDGVSQETLLSEYWSLYHDEELPELKLQYKDYAVWQKSDTYQQMVSKDKAYWLDVYSEENTALELPLDQPRSINNGDEGGKYSIQLDSEISAKLRELANEQGVTMYNLLLTVYNVFLSKVSNQEDIVVGTPVAGRHHADLEGLVGMFVNTLVLRNQVDNKQSFKDLLKQIQNNTVSAFDHQLYPYEDLIEALDVPRTLDRNTLFDVFFAYSKEINEKAFSDDVVTITGHDVSSEVAKFDLSLTVQDANEIDLSFNYRKDLFHEPTIARFAGYLQTLITSLLQDQEQPVNQINMLSQAENDRLLKEFNNTAVDYDRSQTVMDLFEAHVTKKPNAPALILGEEELTYRELDQRSDLWAAHLIDAGVEQGSIVGLITTRSTEMITAILAVLKTGAAYLPINPNQPVIRTEHMLTESECRFVITNINDWDSEMQNGCTRVTTDELDNSDVVIGQLPKVTPESLAYIIYTSGSTGMPKGVMLHQESIANMVQYQIDYLQVKGDERILLFSPYYFDASVEQIWLALATGSALVLINEENHAAIGSLDDYMRKHEVTHCHTTPSLLEKVNWENLPSLRRVIAGGEVCKLSLAQKVSEVCTFYNEYGPTETTVFSTITRFDAADQMLTIGQPIANTQIYVLDEDLNLLPEGAIGQMYIGGKGLASGYLKQPDKTAERFIKNPFADGKMYKTGDLVRWLPNGTLMFFGREDDQVKLNGVRIELGEIESNILEMDAVQEAVVSLKEVSGNMSLVAYIVAKNQIDVTEVRAFLIERLPLNMIPNYFMQIDAIPMTASGKIAHNKLVAPEERTFEYKAASNQTEEQLVSIWSDILQLEKDQISVNRSFFEIGGNSLLAMTLTNRITKTLQVEVSLKELFVKQSIENIAAYITTVQQLSGSTGESKQEAKLLI